MNNKLIIRRAQKIDWKEIQRLNHEMYSHQAEFDPYLDFQEPFTKQAIKEYKDDVTNPEKCTLIAEINHFPIGYLVGSKQILSWRKVKLAEINHMAVSPKYRGQGIGSKLMNQFRDWCRQNKLDRIFVTAYYQSKDTVSFYKKHGLKPESLTLEGKV